MNCTILSEIICKEKIIPSQIVISTNKVLIKFTDRINPVPRFVSASQSPDQPSNDIFYYTVTIIGPFPPTNRSTSVEWIVAVSLETTSLYSSTPKIQSLGRRTTPLDHFNVWTILTADRHFSSRKCRFIDLFLVSERFPKRSVSTNSSKEMRSRYRNVASSKIDLTDWKFSGSLRTCRLDAYFVFSPLASTSLCTNLFVHAAFACSMLGISGASFIEFRRECKGN